MSMNIDLVSDLHIDAWDRTIGNIYPCGPIKHFPINWEVKVRNNVLVVAGDIADDLDISISYLNYLTNFYDKVLFVDGNHEHIYTYPDLYDNSDIIRKVRELKNNKLVYLSNEPYIYKGNVFIGFCGWWDYFNDEDLMKKDMNYFKNWREDLGPKEGIDFMKNVIEEGNRQIEELKILINRFENDDTIKNIIMVTHTVPLKEFSRRFHIEVNSKYQDLIQNNNKLNYWFFGHTHQQFDLVISNIRFISNPRGRPEDFNREEYCIKKVNINGSKL